MIAAFVLDQAKPASRRFGAHGFQQAAIWKSWRSIVWFREGVKRKLARHIAPRFTEWPESNL
ncbi:hypothetical protein [Manganibacter manganicus]|uniref:Uncharacterized protein n=1 Tax=Manganibacter manganicus TaxID=1873176 RepID=A0A1V8RPN3_9HYPH|nr:hypothetical protein [Pseudaminobacter manganicus]OQM75147.1 hypothetical protein BFN67_19990 [Pseudaminobacter manganicus]